MSEEEGTPVSRSKVVRNVLLVIAVIYVITSLYYIFESRGRLDRLEKATAADVKDLKHEVNTTNNNLRASTETLGERLGMTEQDLQKSLSARAAQLDRQQKAAEQRLAEQQKQQKQEIGQVTGEVAGVKTELGSAKTDIATTKTDLESTKQKLERAIGDLGVQSGLIAHTRDDLEVLRHKGDRNYIEFALQKGAKPSPIANISLQLKKTDAKKGRFTVNVMADDRTIEKKDRTMNEPLQFYSGRDRQLYEVVIFTVDKNKVTGYMSTPKTAPAPAR